MPQLKSGRQFILSCSPLKHALSSGTNEQMYYRILQYRLSVHSAVDILPLATIGYFDLTGNGPPSGTTHDAGFTAGDVLEGLTDWSSEEVEEFRAWSVGDAVDQWLVDQFGDINETIKNSPVWASDLVLGD